MESRLGHALLLYAYGLLGVFLVAAPWTAVWEQATVAFVPASLQPWMLSGWLRGLVTGLGLLDLVVAFEIGGHLWTRASPRTGA